MILNRILLFLLTLSSFAFAYEYENRYISHNFNSNFTAIQSALQGSAISLSDELMGNNPSIALQSNNYFVEYSSVNLFDGEFSADKLLFSLKRDSVSSLLFSLSWVDYGSWYDTRSLEKDVIVLESGEYTADSIGYWDDEKVIERSANDFLLETIYGRKINEELSFGVALNALYRTNEVESNFGTSIDVSGTYLLDNYLFTAILKNLGASVVADFENRSVDYQYPYLQLGLGYKKYIRGNDSFLNLLLSHNSLLYDNSDITAGLVLNVKSVFELYASYSLKELIDEEYFEYDKFGVGAGLNFDYVQIKYGYLFDSYNPISGNLTVGVTFN